MSRVDHPDGGDEFTPSTEWVEFDEADGVYRVTYDPAVDETSLAVVSTVASVSGTDPVDLDPLYDAVDPAALDRLFRPDNRSESCRMTFRFCELDVTIDATGIIELNEG